MGEYSGPSSPNDYRNHQSGADTIGRNQRFGSKIQPHGISGYDFHMPFRYCCVTGFQERVDRQIAEAIQSCMSKQVLFAHYLGIYYINRYRLLK